MPSFAPARADRFDILQIFDRGDRPPEWARELLDSAARIETGHCRGASRNLWAAQLDEAVRHAERPVLLVAHGVSCLALAWWAKLSPAPYVERVAAALLVGPSDALTQGREFARPKTRFPFPSVVIDRGEDRRAAEQAMDFAESCGSRFIDGGQGVVSRDGILRRLTAMIVEHEVRVALRHGDRTPMR